jgi:prepilin-type N-terminal cleavage/methylation domain-containing protein
MRIAKQSTGACASPQGFTLIELLVVVSIIAILASLTASGVFQYLEAQTQANTETNMRAVDKVLRQHLDVELSLAAKTPMPDAVIKMATNNGTVSDPQQKRARVIWSTLWIVKEFPMSYAEARNPVAAIATSPVYGSLAAVLPGKKTYINALKTASGAGTPVEPATCLLLALSQSRGGVRLDPENLHSGAADTNSDGLKEVVDGWGNPLGFYRFPTGNQDLDGIKPSSLLFRNPLDPEGTLMDPAWNNPATRGNPGAGPYWFEKLCHSIHDPKSGAAASFYAPPVLVSSARDG